MKELTIIGQGIKIFLLSQRRKIFGFKQYRGNTHQICRSIIEDCWHEKEGFFSASAGHFNIFYIRDFGWCCESLLTLGYRDRVKKTLIFALKHYQKHGSLTTCITASGTCFDFPSYSIDSLPYLLRSLNLLGDKTLIQHFEPFLNKEISKFYDVAIDPKTGLVRENTYFSSMRDQVIRKSSCYDNCMAALLQS